MKRTPKKHFHIDWLGLGILFAPTLFLINANIFVVCVCLILLVVCWLPLVAIARDWGSSQATCYWCGSKKVTNMFQTAIGAIHYGCGKHTRLSARHAQRFTYLGGAK